MGEQHTEPPAARSERTKTEEASRIRSGRSAETMRLGPALGLTLALTAAGTCARSCSERTEFLGSFAWESQQSWFGGFSALELSADGAEMTAITDRARLVQAEVSRGESGITAIRIRHSNLLRGHDGAGLIGRIVDSEGLAIAPDGSIFISFERVHRVSRYSDPARASESLDRPPAFRHLPYNGGFEALAIDDQARLIAIPEDVRDEGGNIPVYRWGDGIWSQPFSLRGAGRFLPVGADIGPDRRLYVLERSFNLFGFRSRVRSWIMTETGVADERCELETGGGMHGNLEGLSVWRDGSGRVRLTMVADDNFFLFQRSELVEYALTN